MARGRGRRSPRRPAWHALARSPARCRALDEQVCEKVDRPIRPEPTLVHLLEGWEHVGGAHRPVRRGQDRGLRVASGCRVVHAHYRPDLRRAWAPSSCGLTGGVDALVVRRRWCRDPVGRRGPRRAASARSRSSPTRRGSCELAGGQLLRSQLRDRLDRAPLQVDGTARVRQLDDRTRRRRCTVSAVLLG